MVVVGDPGGPPAPLGKAVIGVAATIAIAWLSHRLVERPFLRLKDRMRSTPVAGLQEREGTTTVPAEWKPQRQRQRAGAHEE
jgi:peptidoglycan/LPS O-acetylase OafA/YrhL